MIYAIGGLIVGVFAGFFITALISAGTGEEEYFRGYEAGYEKCKIEALKAE